MEQINYDKLQYDTIRNKQFMMIEQPGPSKHLSTLKDRYHSVHWGISHPFPLKNTTPLFRAKPPSLNRQTVQALRF